MAESLETGLILMAAGMGTVYLLLAALVFIIHGVSKLSRRLDRAVPAVSAPPQATTPAADTELVTVIGAAVAAYRRDENRPR